MATIVDDFERADGAIGSDYTSEPFANSWQISSGRATGGESYGTSVIHDTPTDTADQYLETVPDAASNGCDHTLLLRVASDVSGADVYRLVGQEVYFNGAYVAGYWGAILADPTLRVEVNGDGNYEFSVDGVVRHTGTPVRAGGTGSNHVGMRGTSSAFWHSLSFGDVGGSGPVVADLDAAASLDTATTPAAAKAARASTAPTVDTASAPVLAKILSAIAAGSAEVATAPAATKTASATAAASAETATTPTIGKSLGAGTAPTVEAATSPTMGKVLVVDPAVETDVAGAPSSTGSTTVTAIAATEADSAPTPTARKVLVVDVAVETAAALDVARAKVAAVATAVEVDVAQLLGDRAKLARLVAAAERDHAPIPVGGPADTRVHPTGTSVLASAPAGASTLAAAPAGASTMTATPEGSSAWQT